MKFDAPAGLLLLAAVPLAALLLLRRQRRRPLPLAAFLLLRDLVDSLPLLPRSFLLRRRLQMLFLLGALACAGLAGGAPILGHADDPPQRAVLLLDTLCPGGDSVDRESDWKQVTGAAAAAARSFRGDDRILVVRSDTGIIGDGLLTPGRAAALIERQTPSSLPFADAACIDLLAVLDQAHAPAFIGIFTVGAARWRPLLGSRGPAWRLISGASGQRPTNHGLLDVEVRPDLMRSGRIAVFCRAGHFGPAGSTDANLSLTVERDGREIARRAFRLSAAESRIEVFPALDAGSGLLRIALSPQDHFPDDDVYLTPLRGGRAVPTLLVTEGNAALEYALRALPGLDLGVRRPEVVGPPPSTGVQVYDAVAPPEMAGNLLVIAPPGGLPGIGYRGDAPAPGIVQADATHFLLHGVSFGGLRLRRLPLYEVPSGMDVLVTAGGHPLLAVGRAPGGARLALLSFDSRETDWVYSSSFPILIANLAAWLAESPGETRSSFRVGDPLPAALARSIRRVSGPAGSPQPPPPNGWQAFRFPSPGRWRITGAGPETSGEVFVNLLDARVSAAAAAVTSDGDPQPPRSRPFRFEAQAALLVAALVLLLLEHIVAPPQRAGRLG